MYNDGKVWKKLYSKKLFGTSRKRRRRRRKPTFKAGDKVMLSKVRRTFKKGYLPGWTEEIFIVDRVINSYVPSYKIKEYDGTPVKGTFYEEELQRSIWVIKTRFSRSKSIQEKRRESFGQLERLAFQIRQLGRREGNSRFMSHAG